MCHCWHINDNWYCINSSNHTIMTREECVFGTQIVRTRSGSQNFPVGTVATVINKPNNSGWFYARRKDGFESDTLLENWQVYNNEPILKLETY
jgi:hypothetical protein